MCIVRGCPFYGSMKGYCSKCYITAYPKVRDRKRAERAKRVILGKPKTVLPLPPEIWHKILLDNLGEECLDILSLGRLQLVCKALYHHINSVDVWKTAWRRYSGGEDDEGWKELLDRKESKRKKKPLIERPQKPTPLQLGEMLNRRFVKERVFECCVCSEFSVAENAYENEELPTCSECRRQVCDQIGKCYENCHYCGAVLCKNCGEFCVSCGEAQHCHADDWTMCDRCDKSTCPACDEAEDLCIDCRENPKGIDEDGEDSEEEEAPKKKKSKRKQTSSESEENDEKEEDEDEEDVVEKPKKKAKRKTASDEEEDEEDEEPKTKAVEKDPPRKGV